MPFIEEAAAGGFLPVQDTREKPRSEDGGMSTAAKLGTVGLIGAGLYGAPLLTLGGLVVGGGASLMADDEGRDAAFRTENTVGSFLSSESFGYDGKADESFDTWADIAGTEYEPHWERFTRARNKEHADLIRADIEREKKDRQYLESQGMLGFAQSMAAGLFDLPSLLPGGAVVRTARGGISTARSALTVGAFGAGGAAITEGALQATQQLRTAEESAMNIAGATILSGVLGAGMASRMGKAEMAAMGRRVEQEFGSPRVVGEDPQSPEVTTSRPVDELETQLRQVASEILPDSVKLDVVESLAAPRMGDDQFAMRAGSDPVDMKAAQQELIDKRHAEMMDISEQRLAVSRRIKELRKRRNNIQDAEINARETGTVSFKGKSGAELADLIDAEIEGLRSQRDELGKRQREAFDRLNRTKGYRFDQFSLRGFYSPAIRAAENISQAKGTGEQFWKQITKVPGVRKDELEWMGLEEFLAGKKSVTRDEVLTFMRAHQVELDEKVLGGDSAGVEVESVPSAEAARERGFDMEDSDYAELEGFWSVQQGDSRIFISKFADERTFVVHNPRTNGTGEAANFQDAQHIAVGFLSDGGDGTKFSDYKVPGGENYRELLIRLPELGPRGLTDAETARLDEIKVEMESLRGSPYGSAGMKRSQELAREDRALAAKGREIKYESPHFQDQELVHLRVDDRTGPNGERVLFINEVQSDLHQKGRKVGYETDATPTRAELDQRVADADRRWNEFVNRNVGMRVDRLHELPEAVALEREVMEAYAAQRKPPVPNAPFKGDLWLELALKRALRYASENGYDAVSWARSDQIAKAVGADPEDLSIQYNQKIGKFLSKYTKKWGGEVERKSNVADATFNQYLSITPEMRSSVMEGQPLGIRSGEGGATAEGKFNRDEMLITISRAALDPVGTLHHEAVHALRAINIFTPREWKALQNAAKSKGWMDVPEIKDYQKIYGKPFEDDNIVEEAIAMAFQRHVSGEQIQRGILGSVFQRLKNFLERIAGVLKGQGMNTADDVFKRIREGDVAARAEPGRGRTVGRTAAGAASAQEGDLKLKSAFGAEKALAFLSPAMRLQNSPARESRRWVAEIAETALSYNDHKDWIATARGGAEMGEPGSVETRVKLYDANIAAGFKALDSAFMQYRKGTDKRRTGDLTVTSLRDATAGPPQGKMDYRQFREAVSSAMRRGDEHEIPEVAKAAKILRKEVFEPLLKRAIDLEMLPADVSPETAASYLNRMYNKERIVAERPQFKDVVAKWLQENEIHNEVIRGRLVQYVDEFATLDAEVKKINARMKQRAKRDLDKAREGQQLDEKTTAKDEADQEVLAERTARQNDLRKLMEEQIEQYQGKTAKEAKAAIEARRQVEEARDPDAARLRSADKDVMKAAKKIADQVAKEDAELDTLADEIIDRILGTPEGRLPYDAHLNQKSQFGGVNMEASGPLAARQFMIPDERIEPWLENDIDILTRAYVHTMAADTELTARFGSPDMVMQFKQINEEYARLAANTDAKGRKKLHERKKNDFLDLGAIRDRIRGTYALPENPDALTVRVGRNLMTLNYMRLLGGMTISAIPDLHRFIAVNGVLRTFGDGLVPMFRNFSGYRKSGDEAKWLSGALEMVTDNRAMRIADISDSFGRHTKFERTVQSAGRNFGMVSLMAPWNAVMKQLAGTVTQTRVLRSAEKLFSGKPLKQRDIEYMADLGIPEGALRQIGEQFKKHGHKEGGVWFANTSQWDEGTRAAIEALRVGLRKEVDRIIVTPSFGEKPRFASTLTGAMLLQFKSFAISATQKMLVSGLQARDLNQVNGAALAIALGGLVHILKGAVSGRDVEVDWNDSDSVKQFAGNAFDRSGIAGVLMEFNNISEKVTDGRVGLSALTGKPISRYASRNVTASLLGPGFGLAEDSFQALNAALGTRDWKSRDTHNARQLLPYSNLFYLRSAFDRAEEGINEAFGVPER